MTYADDKKYLLNVYNKYDLDVTKARGMYLYTKNGKYLDMFSSIATNSLGHRNFKVLFAIRLQTFKYLHISNQFVSKSVVKLAKLLVDTSFASKVFFTNSGTEANEAALKLVRLYGSVNNKKNIISLVSSFHGRSYGGMSLTGQIEKTKKYSPLLTNIQHINRNDIEELRNSINDSTAAVFLELIQGEGGVHPIREDYILELVKLREKHKFLIIVDDVQAGLLRSGLLHTYMHYNFTPDIMTLAKSLGGGLPLGAMLVAKELENLMSLGDHGSTFGGNPVACAAGYQVLKKVSSFKMYHHVNLMSDYLLYNLHKLKVKHPKMILDIRGRGLIIGVEIAKNIEVIKDKLFVEKILINITNKNTIRLLPALIIKKKHIDLFIHKLDNILLTMETNYIKSSK